MTPDDRSPSDESLPSLIPTAWLIVPTLALLFGQAAVPLPVPRMVATLLLTPLPFLLVARCRRWALLVLLAGLATCVGYVRHHQLLFPEFPADHLRSALAGEGRLYLEGTLRHEPERGLNRSRWHIRAERIWHPAGAQEIHGDLVLGLRAVRREWRFGDRVRFWVRPILPQNSGNPGGFEYATHLARRGVYVTGFLESDREVELLARGPPSARGFVEDLRRRIRGFVEAGFSAENGALINALVVGDTGGITRDQRAAFTASGLNHVLAISGLHVGMLGLVTFTLIRWGASFSSYLVLRCNLLKIAALVSFIAVIFYAALAGGKVPTLRSAIMIGVYQLAVLLDREEEVFASLTLAALIIALLWPGVVADLSFQLSFLAVLFIVWGMRKAHQWFPPAQRAGSLPQERSRFKPRLRQAGLYLAVPLLATLGTGPMIAYYFGHLSLAGFIANPLVVPVVGFVVVPLGLAIGLCALVAPQLALWLVWIAEYPVSWTAWLVESFARIPMAKIAVASPNPLEVALLYGLLVSGFALRKKSHLGIALTVGILLLTADAAYWWRERYQRKHLRITHLNVGQGEAAVVELPGSKVLLIDAGGTGVGDFDTGEAIVAPYLRSRKILKVDYAAVTHARIDHYGGMRTIVEQFSPDEFWSGAARAKTRRFEDLEDALERTKTPRVALSDVQPCREFDGVRVCSLFPPGDDGIDSPAVLRLEYGKLRYLFASDIGKRDEGRLLRQAEELRSAVMTVPRHGGATASTAEFIGAVQPSLAIISAGHRSRSEAGREAVTGRYRQAGAEVLSTYEDGAIIVESDGSTLRYRGYKSGKKGERDLTTKNTKVTKKEDENEFSSRLGSRDKFAQAGKTLRRFKDHKKG